MSRYLTDKEIENILDFIKLNKSIPKDSALAIVKNTKDKLITQLKKQKIYPSLIPELKKQLQINYIKTRIDPGESVGILSAQSIGEKQTQNSIAYDEEIIIKDNGIVRKTTIGKFINLYMDLYNFKKIDEHSHIQECKNIQIMTVTHDEKIQWQDISEISRHAPKGNLIKVTTESGRSVVSTLSHSHLKKDKKKVVPVLGSDLKLEDRIPIIKKTPIILSDLKKIDITEYIQNYTIGPWEYDTDGSTPLNSPINIQEEYVYANGDRFKRYIDIDDTFIDFLGIFMANGTFYFHTNQISLESKGRYDPQTYDMIERFCIKYNLEFDCKQQDLYFFQSFKDNKTTTYTIRSKILNTLLRTITFESYYGHKCVPDFIFGLDKDYIDLFLYSYFKEGGFQCDFTYLNKDIQFLLTYFGIYSRIVNNKLVIQQKYKDLFNDEIGLEINKNNLEDDFQVLDDLELNEQYTRLLYNFKDEYVNKNANDIKITSDMEIKKINTDSELEDLIFRYTMDAHRYNENTFTTGNYFDVEKNLEYLYQVYKSDVVWEKITKLELIFEKDYKHKYVYDFSVKGNETFALFSGIVVHNTLNTFHKAGQNEASVTVGVPRFQELLNATKSPRMVNCKIFFNKGNESIQELRNTINYNIVSLKLKDLTEDIQICLDKEDEWWYEPFKILYNSEFENLNHCISIKLNKKIIFKYRISIDYIVERIEKEYDDLKCVFSPPSIGRIDIFVDVTNIKFNDKQLLFVTEDNINEIYLDECVQPILEKLNICGIPGINMIYFAKSDKLKDNGKEEWFVETEGCNFRKLLGHNLIDITRLQSNNVWDIYENLGVEAARQFLIDEFMEIMDGINQCHVKLLVDKMTFTGTISSITRYTLRKDESGPISKSSLNIIGLSYIKSIASLIFYKATHSNCGKILLCLQY